MAEKAVDGRVVPYLRAGFPIVVLQTSEQERAFASLSAELVEGGLRDLKVYVWKVTTGLRLVSNPQEQLAGDLLSAINKIAPPFEEPESDVLCVLFNVGDFLKSPAVRQALRDAAYALKSVGSYLVCIGPELEVPSELEDVVTVLDFPLPDREKLRKAFSELIEPYRDALSEPVTDEVMAAAVENALGMSELRAESALGLSLVLKRLVDVDVIRAEKKQVLRRSKVLEFVEVSESMDDVGGFDLLKRFVGLRRRYYKDVEKARAFGMSPPKGILIVGVAGTGKSLISRAIARELDLPLYNFNVGAVFSRYVGGSESAVREACRMAEAAAPCVVRFDEFEKAVAGLESSSGSDAGTTSRVISHLLTWMQETRAPLYKVATANTIRQLDAALLRRGRWDAVFAVDLPTQEELKQIFAIHLRKRGRKPEAFDLDALAKKAAGFVGAEVESVVEEALAIAFAEERDVTQEDLLGVCSQVVPISVTDKEDIEAFRKWIKGRAQPVSSAALERKVPAALSREIKF